MKQDRNPIPAPARVASTCTKTLVELTESFMVGTSRRGASRRVEVVDLQHGIHEVDERMAGQLLDARRRSPAGQVVTRGVHA